MAVATSVLAPPLLRATLRRTPADPEEEARLSREAREARSFLHGVRRMLVPVRDGRYALVAGEVVARLAGERDVEAVALHVRAGANGDPPAPPPAAGQVHWQQRAVAAGGDVAARILEEAGREYDLLVLGAAAGRHASGLFGPVTDAVLREAPCTALVLQAPGWREGGLRLRRILLPTSGRPGDMRAAEFALALARGAAAEVIALHVLHPVSLAEPLAGRAAFALSSQRAFGAEATAAVARLGEELGIPVRRELCPAGRGTVGGAIVRWAAGAGCDLILMHAVPRVASGELFGGRTVEQVLRGARCAVAVLLDPAR